MKNKTDKIEHPHHGEILFTAAKNTGLTFTAISELLGFSRTKLYSLFKKEKIDVKDLIIYSRKLKVNLENSLPEIKFYFEKHPESVLLEESPEYDKDLLNCMKRVDEWKTRSYNLAIELSQVKETYYKLFIAAEKKGVDISQYTI